MPPDAPPSPVVAACFRSPYLALVLIANHDVSALRRHCLASTARTPERQAERIARFATDYGASNIILEPGTGLAAALDALGFATTTTLIADAKRAFVRNASRDSNGELFRTVIAEHPKLRRLVTVLNTGKVAESERWRTILLLAAALGLATHRPATSSP